MIWELGRMTQAGILALRRLRQKDGELGTSLDHILFYPRELTFIQCVCTVVCLKLCLKNVMILVLGPLFDNLISVLSPS